MGMSPRLLRPRASNRLLLDIYGSAAAAYSLRKLRTAYTGPVVRVRRSSDNAESDFTATEVSGGTLASWVGANDGFVTKWYDQSGSGRDVTQATSTKQPKIVSSGSLVLLNGKPSMEFGAFADEKLVTSSNVTTGTALTFSGVFSAQQSGTRYHKLWQIGLDLQNGDGCAYTPIMGGTFQDWIVNDTGFIGKGWSSGRAPRIISNGTPYSNSISTQADAFGVLSSSNAKLFVNNAEVSYRVQSTGDTGVVTNDVLAIANGVETSQSLYGRTQEIVLWFSNRFSDRAGIRNNQKAFYNLT